MGDQTSRVVCGTHGIAYPAGRKQCPLCVNPGSDEAAIEKYNGVESVTTLGIDRGRWASG